MNINAIIGERGQPFLLNHRLDILDEKENWLEARVIEVIL